MNELHTETGVPALPPPGVPTVMNIIVKDLALRQSLLPTSSFLELE